MFVSNARNVRNDRATPAEIASYYQHYVSQMSLEDNFACGTTVTSVTRQPTDNRDSRGCWRIKGLQCREGEDLGGRDNYRATIVGYVRQVCKSDVSGLLGS